MSDREILRTTTLNRQQQRFVQNYVGNGHNATMAVVDAGYAVSNAETMAYDLLQLPHVQTSIKAAELELSTLASVHVPWITQQLHDIATASASDCYEESANGDLVLKPISQLPRMISKLSVRRNRLGEQEISVSMPSQLQALELLGRSKAMFTDRQVFDVSLSDGDKDAKQAKLEFLQLKLKAVESAD